MSCCCSQESVASKDDEEKKEAPFVIYFVKLGRDLFQKRIDILTRSAQWKGATVIAEFHHPNNNNNRKKNRKSVPPPPITITHLIISEQITSIEQVAKALRFSSKQQFEDYLKERNIRCAVPKWIINAGNTNKRLKHPSILRGETWIHYDSNNNNGNSNKKKRRLIGSDTDNTNSFNHGTTKNVKAMPGTNASSSSDDGQRSTTYLTRTNNNNNKINDSTIVPTLTNTDTKTTASRRPTVVSHNNHELSELFLTLAKLHKDCPLLGKLDEWKAYCFHLVAGRIRQLPFEIPHKTSYDDDDNYDTKNTLQQLSQIKGFGKSTVQKIEEYISTGTISRIREFHCDPGRMAMKNMMNIWGIGSVKAYQLVQQGYTNIKQVRNAIQSNELFLDRNQLIGVDVYEDILENMTREEVEQIGAIISDAVQHKFQQISLVAPQQQQQQQQQQGEEEDPPTIITPRPEITIMGSYRRGKEGCGDVDVLITSKEYFDTVHPTILGEIVDHLYDSGHIAHHLTFIDGMKDKNGSGNSSNNNNNVRKNVKILGGDTIGTTGTDNDSSNDDDEGSIDKDDLLFSDSSQAIVSSQGSSSWVKRRTRDQREYDQKVQREQQQSSHYSRGSSSLSPPHSCYSYMGVFVSPATGKRRRVDIKFYPYRERIFATLYFTGNGHFNRSMRLWAKRKFNYSLNDHGLFFSEENTRSSSRRNHHQHHGERVAVMLRKSDHDNNNTSNDETAIQNNIMTSTGTTTTTIPTETITAAEQPTKTVISCRTRGKNQESPDHEAIAFNNSSSSNSNSKRVVNKIEEGKDDEDDLVVIPVVETEKQVFDFLQLEYKEPWERDCFDAVVGKQHSSGSSSSFASSSSSSILMSESDFYRDNTHHVWIE